MMLSSSMLSTGSMMLSQVLAASQRGVPILASSLARYSQVAYATDPSPASSPAADPIPEEAGRIHSVSTLFLNFRGIDNVIAMNMIKPWAPVGRSMLAQPSPT